MPSITTFSVLCREWQESRIQIDEWDGRDIHFKIGTYIVYSGYKKYKNKKQYVCHGTQKKGHTYRKKILHVCIIVIYKKYINIKNNFIFITYNNSRETLFIILFCSIFCNFFSVHFLIFFIAISSFQLLSLFLFFYFSFFSYLFYCFLIAPYY